MYYVYQITNVLNEMIYVGYHFSKDIQNDSYMGSGKRIISAVKKYGKENFKREILFEFDNIEDALNKEKEIVNLEFVLSKNTYNICLGGSGFPIHYIFNGTSHNKNKIGLYHPIENKQTYVTLCELDTYINLGWIPGTYRKNYTPIYDNKHHKFKYIPKKQLNDYLLDSRYEQRSTTSGKIVVTHIETKTLKYINETELELYLTSGYTLGNLKSGVNKNTIYVHDINTRKNKRMSPENLKTFLLENPDYRIGRHQKEMKIKNIHNPETGVELHINMLEENINEYLNNGYKLGNRPTRKTNKHTFWIHKMVISEQKYINKRVLAEDVMGYQNDGWVLGFRRNIPS